MTRTRAAALAAIAVLAVAGCNTEPTQAEPAPPRAEVVERISYEEHPPRGTEATLGGVGALRVCLLDADGQPTDNCVNVAGVDSSEWNSYQVGDPYPVEGTRLEGGTDDR